MISVIYKNAMAEVLEYLKGIRKEDIDKIPKKFINYLEKNASKDYKCNFDIMKPLKDLELLEESREIISMICINYWCTTDEEKSNFVSRLKSNESRYQKKLRERYNPNNIFKNAKKQVMEEESKEIVVLEHKENFFINFINKMKKKFFKNRI